MVAVHLILLLLNQGENRGDVLAWLIQVGVYFFLSGSAAEQHYRAQQNNMSPLHGVKGAAVGANLVTSAIVWAYIIVRGIVRDAVGIFVFVEPISLCLVIAFDVVVAFAIGIWRGSAAENRHGGHLNYP
jgi:hypothetical protein